MIKSHYLQARMYKESQLISQTYKHRACYCTWLEILRKSKEKDEANLDVWICLRLLVYLFLLKDRIIPPPHSLIRISAIARLPETSFPICTALLFILWRSEKTCRNSQSGHMWQQLIYIFIYQIDMYSASLTSEFITKLGNPIVMSLWNNRNPRQSRGDDIYIYITD